MTLGRSSFFPRCCFAKSYGQFQDTQYTMHSLLKAMMI